MELTIMMTPRQRDMARALFFRRKHLNQTYTEPVEWSDSEMWWKAKEEAKRLVPNAIAITEERVALVSQLRQQGAPVSKELTAWVAKPLVNLHSLIRFWG